MIIPPNGTTPADFARAVASPPILSSDDRGWKQVSLHRFQVPQFDVRLGASYLHRVTVHLAGPVLIERSREGQRDCRWSREGLSNVVPAGVPVTRSFRGQADFLAVYLASEVVAEVAADALELDPSRVELVESLAAVDDTLAALGRLIMAEAEAGGAGTRMFIDMLARALALHLLRTYSTDAAPPPAESGALIGWRLCRATDYMHAHIAEDIPLVRLAAAAGLSPSHFARAFRAATGEPPHRYLTRLRIEAASHLLEQTRLPIIDVGLRCGFAQASHFATMFRKATGLSPRAYRAARCT